MKKKDAAALFYRFFSFASVFCWLYINKTDGECYKDFQFHIYPTSVDFDKCTVYKYLKNKKVFVYPCNVRNAQVTSFVNSDLFYTKETIIRNPSAAPLILELEDL